MLLSLVLWFALKLAKDYDYPIAIQVQYELPAGMIHQQPPPKQLTVTLHASGWQLLKQSLSLHQKTLKIDLTNRKSGGIERNELITLATSVLGMEVVDVDRSYIPIDLVKTTSRRVPVVLQKQITLRQNYLLAGPVVIEPDSVTVTGPEEEIKRIDQVPTEVLTLSDLNRSMEVVLKLETPPLETIHFDHHQVKVRLPVEQFTELEFDVAVSLSESLKEAVVYPRRVKLWCVTALSNAQGIQPTDFVIGIDESEPGLAAGFPYAPLKVLAKPPQARNIRLSSNAAEIYFFK